jgi:uncharacterized protein YchJ
MWLCPNIHVAAIDHHDRLVACMGAVVDEVGADPAVLLRSRERRSVLGRELFIVTAMGPSDLFSAHAQDIDNWFASSAFVPVEEGK